MAWVYVSGVSNVLSKHQADDDSPSKCIAHSPRDLGREPMMHLETQSVEHKFALLSECLQQLDIVLIY